MLMWLGMFWDRYAKISHIEPKLTWKASRCWGGQCDRISSESCCSIRIIDCMDGQFKYPLCVSYGRWGGPWFVGSWRWSCFREALWFSNGSLVTLDIHDLYWFVMFGILVINCGACAHIGRPQQHSSDDRNLVAPMAKSSMRWRRQGSPAARQRTYSSVDRNVAQHKMRELINSRQSNSKTMECFTACAGQGTCVAFASHGTRIPSI